MKHRSLLAIAAVGTLIFAACGDDDDDDAADTVAEAPAGAEVTTAGADATEAPVAPAGAETTEAGVAGAETTAAADIAGGDTTEAGVAGAETSGPAVETTATAAVETSGPAADAVESTAVETTAVETTAVETTAADTTAVETTAAETTAVETSAVETTAAETTAVETTEAAVAAVETSAVETTAAETTAVETSAVETTAAETTAVETTEAAVATVETSAVETSSVETSAVETSAVETSAVETSAVETSAVETTAAAVESSAPTSAPTESTAPTESVPTEVVGTGPECATLPNFGDGAFSELADDTAGTAISNTQETSTLQQFLGDAEPLETLDGEGPFTVFAPRNRAFVDLGDQLALLAEDPEALAAVLNYHVVEGEALTSEDLAAGDPLLTLQGEEVTVEVDADVVTFNDGQATAVCGDIPLANGTLFILDAALVPESVATAVSVPPTTEAAAETSAPGAGASGSTEPTDGTEPTASSGPADSTGTTEAGGAPSGVAFPVTPGPDWPESLTFTLTPSSEAGGLIATAEPLAAMLEERLGLPVEALVPTDYAGVIVALQSGQAHVAGGLGPVQMVQAEDEAGAELILQSERFGSFEYVTQWFTNDPATYCEDTPVADEDGMLFCNGVLDATSAADGPIGEEHLADVAGKTVAFVDQGSASGYLVPALQLLNQGVDPVEDITSQFAGTHDATVQAVYDGDADVGVSFNDARTGLVEQFPDVGEKVVVFAWSFPIPNDGFAVAGDLPEDLKEAITAAFLDIAEDPEGAELLADEDLYEIDGLQPVDSADFDVIRELRTELADLLE